MTRDLALRHRPSATQLLAKILEAPDLAANVQALPSPLLAKLIDTIGLEDAGEIVAFASTQQLAEMFDDDLWKSDRPGGDEQFDANRFLLWLQVMLEAGDAFVAEKLASLPEDLVTLALHKHVLVLNVEDLLAEMREIEEDEGKAIDKALSNALSEEIDEYQLVARHHEGWDDVLSAVLALDRDHHDTLVRVLGCCAALSAEQIDGNGGLYEVLTSEEMLESDVAGDREDRRAEVGHVAPSDARAFLKLAQTPVGAPPLEHDPVTRAYFRRLSSHPVVAVKPTPSVRAPHDLTRLLHEAGVTSKAEAPRLLLAGHKATKEPLLSRAMRALAAMDEKAFFARSEEIAYLANVLSAGGAVGERSYRPAEAVRKAVEVCSKGLALAAKGGDPVDVLRTHPAEGLFRMAWAIERS